MATKVAYSRKTYIEGRPPTGGPAVTVTADLNAREAALQAASDLLDLETDAGRSMTQAADAAAQRALLNVENGADVTDEANVTAIHNATAEVTAAPAHWLVLVGGALKRLTHAGFLTVIWAALGGLIAGGTSKGTPVDADTLALSDSAASGASKKLTWANLKAAIKAYADTLYSDLAHQARHRIGGADALPAASDTVSGLVELATAAEVATGTDTGRTPSVATLKASLAETNAWLTKRTKMPDGATAVYSQDAWATTDGWSVVGSGASISVSGGELTTTLGSAGTWAAIKDGISVSGKTALIKIKVSSNMPGGVMRCMSRFAGGYVAGQSFYFPQSQDYIVVKYNLSAGADGFAIYGDNAVAGAYIKIDWLWIGDYSYLTGTLSEEAARIANQLGDTAGVGVAASGTITSNGTAPSDGDTVTIAGKVYTYKTTLGTTEGQILIGASAAEALDNLKAGVNSTGVSAVQYCAAINPLVEATTNTDTVQTLAARSSGELGNSITLAKSAATLTLSGSTLSGGYSDAAAKIITATQNNIAGSGTRPAAARIDIASTSLVGYEQAVDVASGGTTTLPAGGTWIWFCYGYGATISSAKRGSSAGGATLTVAGANATVWYRKYS